MLQIFPQTRHYNCSKTSSELLEEINLIQLFEPDHQPVICRHFGCGVHLTRFEALCGDRCISHSIPPPQIDVAEGVCFE